MGSTGKKALTYSAGLIALYLGLKNYVGLSNNIKSATGGAVNVIKGFQGR